MQPPSPAESQHAPATAPPGSPVTAPAQPPAPDPPPTPTLPASLTVVLPAFNEAERIGPALDELFQFLDDAANVGPVAGLPAKVDVLVVDDGSRDGTAAIVANRLEAQPTKTSEPPRLRLVRAKHAGKGAAVRTGMLASSGATVIFADADMATPPDQLPKLVAALGTADVALGSRIQPDGTDMRASQPPFRQSLGRVFHRLASIWAVGQVEDTQCGFKGFTREAALDIFGRQLVTSIVFDVELIYVARKRGYRIAIVPIRWQDRRGSRMQPSAGLALRVAWDLLRIPYLHLRDKPRS
ncbi:MAG TPA: dolichyl-phosphate beta-glucosyltransferase [Candidatus Limnocylindrales bacterium]|nr:dolichyl-phosphate beta-glucosyltransferase [Candidatus Limnocylindrales bacterium]